AYRIRPASRPLIPPRRPRPPNPAPPPPLAKQRTHTGAPSPRSSRSSASNSPSASGPPATCTTTWASPKTPRPAWSAASMPPTSSAGCWSAGSPARSPRRSCCGFRSPRPSRAARSCSPRTTPRRRCSGSRWPASGSAAPSRWPPPCTSPPAAARPIRPWARSSRSPASARSPVRSPPGRSPRPLTCAWACSSCPPSSSWLAPRPFPPAPGAPAEQGRTRAARSRGVDRAQPRQQLGQLFGLGDVLRAVDDQQRLGDADPGELLDGAQQAVGVAGEPDLHGAADPRRVAAEVGAVPVEDRRGFGDGGGLAVGRIPHVRVLRGHAQRALRPAAADPDRGMRPLHRLRLGDRVLEPVVLAVERGGRLAPQRGDDLQRLLEPVRPVRHGAEGQPEHGVLVLGPSRSDAELEPPAGEVVHGHRHLRQHAGVPVRVAGDRTPDAYPLGQRR